MKNTDIVLVVPPSAGFRQPEEHLGVGYISAVLKKKGLSCEIIDGFLGNVDCQNIKKKLAALKPRIIGFSPYQDSLDFFAELAEFLRRQLPRSHISLGGFLGSFNYAWLFSIYPDLIDSIVIGEGESAFSTLAQKIISGGDWSKVKGIAFVKNGKIIKNPCQSKIADLDSLPFPDRPTIRMTMFQKNPVHICASRGCYGDCSFCSINALGKLSAGSKWRGRSIENVFDEIEFLNKRYGAEYFKFVDDCFFPALGKDERAAKICREVDKRNLKIKFRFSCRANDVDYKIFKELKRRGLFSVSLGVESIIPRQLEEWRKGVTPDKNIAALKICKKLGIIVQMGYIMLDKDSTIAELRKHSKFLKKNMPAITKGIYSSVFAAEGTELTEKYRRRDTQNEKRGINFNYSFISPEVSAVARALKFWTKNYGSIYSWAIDSLSAPRAIGPQSRSELHRLITAFKKRELEIFDGLIELASKNNNWLPLEKYIGRKIKENRNFSSMVKEKLAVFYKKNGLSYREYENIYI